jgi:nucleoside-diphosphate-sugar epimerase
MAETGRRAILTGGTGFVGSHLARRLLHEGWEVHLVVRGGFRTALIRDILPRLVLHEHNGTTDGMASIVEESRPDVAFHLASLFLAQHGPADVEPLVRSNILFPLQLVDAMASRGRYLLVNTSTNWEHYEDREYDPVCLYAATKRAFETLLAYYLEISPMRVVTLKLFDTYGPGDPRPKLFKALLESVEKGVPLKMSPGDQCVDLVHVDDVVEAFVLAAGRLLGGKIREGCHERYAVSSGQRIRLRDLVEKFEAALGETVPVEWGGRQYRPREVLVPWTKGVPLPGWVPRVSLEAGLKHVVAGNRRK